MIAAEEKTNRSGHFCVDPFLGRMSRPGYNCMDFTREVWLALTGMDVTARLTGLVGAFTERKVNLSGIKGFHRLPEPKNPCFVVMQRFKCVPHVGVYLDGRILHLTSRGVQFQPLVVSRAYFTTIRYYE